MKFGAIDGNVGFSCAIQIAARQEIEKKCTKTKIADKLWNSNCIESLGVRVSRSQSQTELRRETVERRNKTYFLDSDLFIAQEMFEYYLFIFNIYLIFIFRYIFVTSFIISIFEYVLLFFQLYRKHILLLFLIKINIGNFLGSFFSW